jgi:site-specific recombinase XerD
MKVVLKNNKLQVRINFTDPSLGVKEGGRIFRWKDTFEEAILFLLSWENDQLVEDHKIHKANTRLYSYELEEAERAFALLKTNFMHSTNVLTDAVKFYVEHHRHTKAMHLKNAFDKWNEVGIREKNLRPDTIRDRKSAMSSFVQKHGDKLLTNLNQQTIKKFIYKPKISQVTKNGYIRVFKGFFKFCVEQGWLLKSPTESIKQGRVDQVEPTIFSVAESKKLIETARKLFDGETLAYFSLLLFAGLRPSEVHGGLLWNPKKANTKPLEWSEVRLNKQFPEITLLHTKGRVIRKIPLMPNCATLLNEVKDRSIIPKDGFRRKYNKVRQEAGVKWKEDICRHSWVTYLFAKDEDLTRKTIARMAGNSVSILDKAYLNRSVTKKEGEKYFSIGLNK